MESSLTLPAPNAEPPAVIGQALLFSSEVELEIEKEERQGRYTLERFKRLRPAAFADCVTLLAAAKPGYEGLRRIAGIVGVHHLTVAGVRDDVDAGKTIDTLRERLSKKMLTAVEMLADRILESPGSIPAGMLGMVIDQLSKNAELLGNRATARVEKREEIDIYAHWDEIKEKLLDPGDVTELPAVIGLAGGNLPAIEAPIADLGELQVQSRPEPLEAGSDAQSLVPTTDPEAARPGDTASATDPDRSPAAADPADHTPDARKGAGGGRRDVAGGGLTRSGSGKQNFPGNGPNPPPI